jgi:transposase-like protein
MDPHTVFCPNPDCPARGQLGQGNIGTHGRQRQRFMCHVCHKPFTARHGTPFYRRRTDEATITLVTTLVAHGCPIPAIQAAFGFQRRTVQAWVDAAGAHCQRVHAHLVLQPRDLGQVQADELRVKTQLGVVWMAMAVMVSTRLWLGGVLSPARDKHLIRALVALIVACALPRPLLLVTDGLVTYLKAFQRAFRTPQPRAGRGRPRLVPWPKLVIGQVVKHYRRRRVVGVVQRVVQGSATLAKALIRRTQGGGVLNTAYIERLNGTFRARLAVLVRRTRGAARRQARLHAGMYLIGTVYNFCSPHASLTLPEQECRTPAMAAGITDHCWSVSELLHRQVPLPRWQPPKRRGRRSKELQQLIERWCT